MQHTIPPEGAVPATGALTQTRRAFAELLAEARARTLLLVSPLSEDEMAHQPEPEVGSVLSELTRIVAYEARWLLDESQPHRVASYDEWFDNMSDVRQRVIQRLDEPDMGDESGVAQRYRRVLEHEYQRGESILETLEARGEPYSPARERRLPRGRRLADPGIMVRFPGGAVEIGAAEQASPWPSEKPSHWVELLPFWIDLMPVTNGDFLTFMGEGGYTTREVWTEEGWEWAKSSQAQMPRHWSWQDGTWWCRCLGHDSPIDFTCPVTHISYHEAEAFARFVGKRLPTETEWEAAAGWDPETQSRRRYPWGNMAPTPHVANLDQLAFGPAAIGAFPGNVSPIGCYGMIGDVWEWTSSDFRPYPGSGWEPSAERRKVVRGGSWASRAGAVRISARRPLLPEARHMFTGFRCARGIADLANPPALQGLRWESVPE